MQIVALLSAQSALSQCTISDSEIICSDTLQFQDNISVSGVSCAFNSDQTTCFTDALAEIYPTMSASCISCFSDNASCTLSNCATICAYGSSAACEECIQSNCGESLINCTNLFTESGNYLCNVSLGCTDSAACNYNEGAIADDGSCAYGCIYCGAGTFWDALSQTCQVANPTDVDLDGCVGVADVLELLVNFGACFNIEPEQVWMCGDTLEYWGYWYETIEIGNQCWFGENLQALEYQNGDAIPSDLSDSDWVSTASGAIATFDASEYGRLYNWHAVNDTRNLCAAGWHVPSDSDWMTLEMTLGMSASSADSLGWRGTDEGAKLKSTLSWNNNGNGNDQFQFTAKPGGNRMHALGIFLEQGTDAIFWTSTPVAINNYAFSRSLNWSRTTIKRHDLGHGKNYGFSVRCVKD